MKSLKRKVMSMFLILVISLFVGTCISSKVNAATKPLLTEKKISVLKGQKQRIGLLYNSKNAKWSVSNKRIKIVKKNNNYSIIKGIKKGDSVLTAKVGSKRYKCKIVVVEHKMTKGEKTALTYAKDYISYNYGYNKKTLKDELKLNNCKSKDIKFALKYCGADWYDEAVKYAKFEIKEYSYSMSSLKKYMKSNGFESKYYNYAVNNCNADWNKEALDKAVENSKEYHYSEAQMRESLKEDGFNNSEIDYAIKNANIDWNNEALEAAISWMEDTVMSKQKLRDYLKEDGYSDTQVDYAITNANIDWNKCALDDLKEDLIFFSVLGRYPC